MNDAEFTIKIHKECFDALQKVLIDPQYHMNSIKPCSWSDGYKKHGVWYCGLSMDSVTGVVHIEGVKPSMITSKLLKYAYTGDLVAHIGLDFHRRCPMHPFEIYVSDFMPVVGMTDEYGVKFAGDYLVFRKSEDLESPALSYYDCDCGEQVEFSQWDLDDIWSRPVGFYDEKFKCYECGKLTKVTVKYTFEYVLDLVGGRYVIKSQPEGRNIDDIVNDVNHKKLLPHEVIMPPEGTVFKSNDISSSDKDDDDFDDEEYDEFDDEEVADNEDYPEQSSDDLLEEDDGDDVDNSQPTEDSYLKESDDSDSDSDITSVLFRIKKNINEVEYGNTGKFILNEIETDYLKLLELIKLFLISERDSYYGYYLMNMQFRANFFVNSIAGIKLNTFPPVFEANPLLFCKFKLKEIIYIVCHEIDHVVLNHPAEMVKSNPEGDPQIFRKFNLAADASVNDRINHEIEAENHVFMSPPDGLITSHVLAKMFDLRYVLEMENYAYYFELIKEKREKNNNQPCIPLPNNKGKSGSQNGLTGEGSSQELGSEDKKTAANGQGSEMADKNQKDGVDSNSAKQKIDNGENNQGQSSKDSEGENSGQQVVTANNYGGQLRDHEWEAGNDAEDAAATVREFVNAANDMMSEEARGLMPAHYMSQVEKINKPPELSWQAILKKYVGTITANKRKTRTRLNRRQPERFDLSGTMDEKVLKIVVAIDTSGSVSNSMISRIMNEIFAILAKRKHDITIIECDSIVQRVYKVKTAADVQMKVAGRGGTAFSPVIEHINEDKYYRDALLIYFTDGYGEMEVPKPRTYRNIWVVIGNEKNLSVHEPYGIVLSMKAN